MNDKIFCYSMNEEDFTGDFKSRDEALAEAIECARDDGRSVVYTGEAITPIEVLRKLEERIGERVIEYLEEWLLDEIASDDAIINLPEEKYEGLGSRIVNWLETNASFRSFGVTKVQKHFVGEKHD